MGIFSGSLLVFELELLSSRNSLVDLVEGLLLLPSAGEPPLAKKFPGKNGRGGALSTGGRGGASTLLSLSSMGALRGSGRARPPLGSGLIWKKRSSGLNKFSLLACCSARSSASQV